MSPRRQARSLTRQECARLARAIKTTLAMAVKVGGTTLRDYVGADGNPGYFRQKLYVYERDGKPCRVCGRPIKHFTQGATLVHFDYARGQLHISFGRRLVLFRFGAVLTIFLCGKH